MIARECKVGLGFSDSCVQNRDLPLFAAATQHETTPPITETQVAHVFWRREISDGTLNVSSDYLNIGAIARIVDQINKSLPHKDYVEKLKDTLMHKCTCDGGIPMLLELPTKLACTKLPGSRSLAPSRPQGLRKAWMEFLQ